MNITVVRGDDGFGSQFLSILSGIAFCRVNNFTYHHSPIKNIKLVNDDSFKNNEIDKINDFLNKFVANLGISHVVSGQHYTQKPFFHNEILFNGPLYYNKEFSLLINSAYPLPKPEYYNNDKLNIAIHVRRGLDIVEADKHYRWINADVYEKLIINLKKNYPDALIHIFSWHDSGIKPGNNIVFHTSYDGNTFLDDFNGLVWSDILVVGSSTFSLSAGLINKNLVLCDKSLYNLNSMYVPIEWFKNYQDLCTN